MGGGGIGDIVRAHSYKDFTPEQKLKVYSVLTQAFKVAYDLGQRAFKVAANLVMKAIRGQGWNGLANDLPIEDLRGPYLAATPGYEGAQGAMDIHNITKEEIEAQTEAAKGEASDIVVPYRPVAVGPETGLVAPKNLADAMYDALRQLEAETGLTVNQYVEQKLKFSPELRASAFSTAQADAVALAIRNIERESSLINSDQTGVGKGRVVAALMRYAHLNGLIPVFVTAKNDLYSDMLARDLPDTGINNVVPAITDAKIKYTNSQGQVVRQNLASPTRRALWQEIARTGELPQGTNAIFTTYFQLGADVPEGFQETARQTARRKREGTPKTFGPIWESLQKIAPKAIFILDEAHNSAGETSDNNARFLSVLPNGKGTYFSSATYAKRPTNLVLYAVTSLIRRAGMNPNELRDMFRAGGIALQQAVTSMLAKAGELVRRQQNWKGVPFHFKRSSADLKSEVTAADTYSGFLSQLLSLSDNIRGLAGDMQDDENQVRAEEDRVRMESMNFGSRLYNLSNQYLFALRAKAIGDEAVRALNDGNKAFVAVMNTMAGPIDNLKAKNLPLTFNGILMNELDNMMTIKVHDPNAPHGIREIKLTREDLNDAGKKIYDAITDSLKTADLSRLPISPIDKIMQIIREAVNPKTGKNYTVDEMTGRKKTYEEEVSDEGATTVTEGMRVKDKEVLAKYNNGDLDAIVVNESGATGLSAHASPKYMDQRKREMIVGQPLADINKFMQMLGRVMRFGQVVLPAYTILQSSIAAERRFMVMLRRKLISLNANTTADTESELTKNEGFSENIFNQVGDRVVAEIMLSEPVLAHRLGVGNEVINEDHPGKYATKVTGKFPLLKNAEAERLWDRIEQRYRDMIRMLDEVGENPLKASVEDFRAKTLESIPFVAATGTTPFDGPATLERMEIASDKQPPSLEEVRQQTVDHGTLSDRVNAWIEKNHEAEAARVAEMEAHNLSPMQIAAARLRYSEARDQVRDALDLIGNVYKLPAGGFLAVPVDIKLSDKPDDMAALSRQELIVRRNMIRSKGAVPMSTLSADDTPFREDNRSDADDFAWRQSSEDSAEKYIVTGNLISGYRKADKDANARPKVIVFTREDGSIHTGIMMPSGWRPRPGDVDTPITTFDQFRNAVLNPAARITFGPVAIQRGSLVVPANAAARNYWGTPEFTRLFPTNRQIRGNLVADVTHSGRGQTPALEDVFQWAQSFGVPIMLSGTTPPSARGPGNQLTEELPEGAHSLKFIMRAPRGEVSVPGETRAPGPVGGGLPERAHSIKPTAPGRGIEQDIASFQARFPSAPPIVLQDDEDEKARHTGKAAYYDRAQKAIIVQPEWMPDSIRGRRGELAAALQAAGISVMPESFWEDAWRDLSRLNPELITRVAKGLGADTSTLEGRQQVLADLVRQRRHTLSRFGLVRRLLKAIGADAESDKVVTAMQRTLERATEQFTPITRREFADEDPDQVYADHHRRVWQLRGSIRALEDQVKAIEQENLDSHDFQVIRRRLEALAGEAEAMTIGRNRREEFDINRPDFLERVRAAGVRLNEELLHFRDSDPVPRDVHVHRMHMNELRARAIVRLMDSLAANRATLNYLTQNLPEAPDPMRTLQDKIERQEARLERERNTNQNIVARAEEIRARLEEIPAAKAARSVLSDPLLQDWIEIINKIEESGARPRETTGNPDMDRSLTVADALFGLHTQAIADDIDRRTQRVEDSLLARINRLRNERLRARERHGQITVGIHELLDAIAGDMEASGSMHTRAMAEEMRRRETAIVHLARALGRAAPDTDAGRFREALEGPDELSHFILTDFTPETELVRRVAHAASISPEIMTDLLRMMQSSPEFRNAVVALADEGDTRAENNLLNAIDRAHAARAEVARTGTDLPPRLLEQEQRRVARRAIQPYFQRLRAEQRQVSASIAAADRQLEEADIEFQALQMLRRLANEAREHAPEDTVGAAKMVEDTDDGRVFLSFTRADGTRQPEVRISDKLGYTQETIKELLDWRDHALLAQTSDQNPPYVTRGLAVAAPIALLSVDANSTPGAIGRTIRPGGFSEMLTKSAAGTMNAVSRMVPGISGVRLRNAVSDFARVFGSLHGLLNRHFTRRMKLMRSAMESMGLDLKDPGDVKVFTRAYSEIAHRWRSFTNEVQAGDQFMSPLVQNKAWVLNPDSDTVARLTPELMTLLRYDRDIFREAQSIMSRLPYGGVRETIGHMMRLVRDPAETGNVGLARRIDDSFEDLLAREINSREKVARDATPEGETPPPIDMTSWWDKDDNFEHVLFHILDADRPDLAFARTPFMSELEKRYKAELVSGRMPRPSSIEDVVNAMVAIDVARHGGTPTIADPHATIRAGLIGELDLYARLAKRRKGGYAVQAKTSSGTASGTTESSEFTEPAAKLIYPSSAYHYGAEHDIKSAVERVANVVEVEMQNALAEAQKSIKDAADRLDRSSVSSNLADTDADLVRWHTPEWFGGNEITSDRIKSAATHARVLANALEQKLKELQSPPKTHGYISKLIGSLYSSLLASPLAATGNLVGGSISTYHALTPIVGRPLAFLMSVRMAFSNALSAALQILNAAAKKLGINIPSEGREERQRFLEDTGLGGQYNQAELRQFRYHTQAPGIGNQVLRALYGIGDIAEKTIGKHIGVTATDVIINRNAAKVAIPFALRRMQRIAQGWASRVDKILAERQAAIDQAGVQAQTTPGYTRREATYPALPPGLPGGIESADPDLVLGPQDHAQAAELRRQLQEAGLNPEQFLRDLANGSIDPRKFWETEAGRKYAFHIITEINAATRANRPNPTPLLTLLGWSAFNTSRLLDMFASPANAGAMRRWMGATTQALFLLASTAIGTYLTAAAKHAVSELQTSAARALAQLLAAPPGDDDDEETWFNWARNVLSHIVASFGRNTTPAVMPWQKSWYERPVTEIISEILTSPIRALGIDRLYDGGGFKTPQLGLIGQGMSAGLEGGRALLNLLSGKPVEAQADFKMAVRDAAQLFGEWGRVAANMLLGTQGKDVIHDVRAAANKAGVRYKTGHGGGGSLLAPTPLRESLLQAVNDLGKARSPQDILSAQQRLADVAKAIHNKAAQETIEKGGFASEGEAKLAAEQAGRRAVQSAMASIETVTRSLGRSVSPKELDDLRKTGILDTPQVVAERKALQAAVQSLAGERSAAGGPVMVPSESITSPLKAGSGGGGGAVSRSRGIGFGGGGGGGAGSVGGFGGGGGLRGGRFGSLPRIRGARRIRGIRGRRPRVKVTKTVRIKLPRRRSIRIRAVSRPR